MDSSDQAPFLQKPALEEQRDSPKLPANIIVDFANFAYDVDQTPGWGTDTKETYNKLVNDGWQLVPFDGTTGASFYPVESASGVLGFKKGHVVIATRGTEIGNWNDWMTNVRFFKSSAPLHFGIEGEIASGFLQTHLSSWDFIQDAIRKYAASLGKEPRDLSYTLTGHSMGAAKAQLNALRLLTDPVLGVGVQSLEQSFIDDSATADLSMSGFYSIGRKTEPHNPGMWRWWFLSLLGFLTGQWPSKPTRLLERTIILNEGWIWNRHLMGTVGTPAIPIITQAYEEETTLDVPARPPLIEVR